MLYWVFTTYRDGLAILIGGPLLCVALPAIFAAAYLLGTGGLKTAEGGWGPKQKRVALAVQAIAGLAAFHLAIFLTGFMAVERDLSPHSNRLLTLLIGLQEYSRTRLLLAAGLSLAAGVGAGVAAREQIRDGGGVRELVDRLREPRRRREELGSAHFCYPGDFAHLAREKPEGLRMLGAFYGKRGRVDKSDHFYRLDAGPNRGPLEGRALNFSVEDQARGMAIVGPPGAGKSQVGILPIIADTMNIGHSVIVADPQGELSEWVLKFAAVTGHLVAIHDPTDEKLPRYNLAAGIATVADAQAIARVMIAPADGWRSDGNFWTKAAQNLMAGCLMRFETLGEILIALTDIKSLAETLACREDEARLLCGDFIHSALETPEQKLGLNISSTLKNSTLANWAAPTVRRATTTNDVSARMLVEQPAVLILRCPGRYRDVYGPYLGAVLQRMVQDLDTIGEGSGPPLPRPVKIVLDEFPSLGRLDAVVTAVNLVRKRRISFVIAAQTLAQLEVIYGTTGTNSLLAGMATQVYFGSCDGHTAQHVSRSLGKATEMVRGPGARADGAAHAPQHRQRDLMTPDEVITPPRGNCTIIYRYATATYAAQIVMLAYLTRMYEREDWAARVRQAEVSDKAPMLLEPPLFERVKDVVQPEEGAPEAPSSAPRYIDDAF